MLWNWCQNHIGSDGTPASHFRGTGTCCMYVLSCVADMWIYAASICRDTECTRLILEAVQVVFAHQANIVGGKVLCCLYVLNMFRHVDPFWNFWLPCMLRWCFYSCGLRWHTYHTQRYCQSDLHVSKHCRYIVWTHTQVRFLACLDITHT